MKTDNDKLKNMRCTVKIYNNFRHRTCGKPAKGFLDNGAPACGIHLRSEKNMKDGFEKYKKECIESDSYRKTIEEILTRIGLVAVHIDYRSKTVVLDTDVFLKFINENMHEKIFEDKW